MKIKKFKHQNIFIPEEFFGTLQEFKELIKKDERIKKYNEKHPNITRTPSKVMSFVIRNYIANYVRKRKSKEDEDELV